MFTTNNIGEIRNNVNYEDFASVFKVFTSAPFFEDWTSEMVLNAYHSLDVKDGIIFGFYLKDSNECVGLLTLRPAVDGEHPVSFPNNSKVMYLSDVATLQKCRGMGIGTELFLHGLRHTRVLGYDYIYLRTNEKSKSMSYRIAEKCGFRQVWDVYQEVDFPRNRPGLSTKDFRVFMEQKL